MDDSKCPIALLMAKGKLEVVEREIMWWDLTPRIFEYRMLYDSKDHSNVKYFYYVIDKIYRSIKIPITIDDPH